MSTVQEFSKLNGYLVKDATARQNIEILGNRIQTIENGIRHELNGDSIRADFLNAYDDFGDLNVRIEYELPMDVGYEYCDFIGRAEANEEEGKIGFRFFKASTMEILTVWMNRSGETTNQELEYTQIDRPISVHYDSTTESLTLGE